MNGGRHGEDGDGGGEEIMKNIVDSKENLDVSNELYEKIKEVSSFFVIEEISQKRIVHRNGFLG